MWTRTTLWIVVFAVAGGAAMFLPSLIYAGLCLLGEYRFAEGDLAAGFQVSQILWMLLCVWVEYADYRGWSRRRVA